MTLMCSARDNCTVRRCTPCKSGGCAGSTVCTVQDRFCSCLQRCHTHQCVQVVLQYVWCASKEDERQFLAEATAQALYGVGDCVHILLDGWEPLAHSGGYSRVVQDVLEDRFNLMAARVVWGAGRCAGDALILGLGSGCLRWAVCWLLGFGLHCSCCRASYEGQRRPWPAYRPPSADRHWGGWTPGAARCAP